MKRGIRHAAVGVLVIHSLNAETRRAVTIQVDAGRRVAALQPVWTFFGYDEPNYTYTKNGTKLVGELAASSRTPVHIRTHNLLTTGDGTASLKFGSTNAYTEDGSGRAIYDWTIIDRIFKTYLQAGAKPLVEIGFMPQALSVRPEPYTPLFRRPADFKNYYLGWSYPPKDYAKWGDLVYQLVRHTVEKYGRAEVESWYWEVWNEPDISYWHGSAAEYDKLYDYSAAAVKRALGTAQVGGPASTSPRNKKAADFLGQFLEHCASGTNAVTGKRGAPLDFISFHAKGAPDVSGNHVRMGLSAELKDGFEGFSIVTASDKFRKTPIILTEADPEGCAACSSQDNPANAYRNGALYPAYTAVAIKNLLDIANQLQANLRGILTWAFEFEDKPYFAGYRDLATNGIDKPVLNIFRMAGMMGRDRIEVRSDTAQSLDGIMRSGVRGHALVDGMAARSERNVTLMVWNYQDDDVNGQEAEVTVEFDGLPISVTRLLERHYRIDDEHSNAYSWWKRLGSPEASGRSRLIENWKRRVNCSCSESPRWISSRNGKAQVKFPLPMQGVSLIELGW